MTLKKTIRSDSLQLGPRLLISVRDRTEAVAVDSLPVKFRELIGVIDLKEPRRGSLGRVDTHTASCVLHAISPDAISSAALGELIDQDAIQGAAELPKGFDFAKIGLAGALTIPNWRQRWRSLLAALPVGTKSVAVAYVDHQSCDAPEPFEVCRFAAELGCRGVLLDTFDKSAGNFSAHIDSANLKNVLEMIREKRMFSVLAGSVAIETLCFAVEMNPTLIGVRGAVCESDRTEAISKNALSDFCQRFKTSIGQIRKA